MLSRRRVRRAGRILERAVWHEACAPGGMRVTAVRRMHARVRSRIVEAHVGSDAGTQRAVQRCPHGALGQGARRFTPFISRAALTAGGLAGTSHRAAA